LDFCAGKGERKGGAARRILLPFEEKNPPKREEKGEGAAKFRSPSQPKLIGGKQRRHRRKKGRGKRGEIAVTSSFTYFLGRGKKKRKGRNNVATHCVYLWPGVTGSARKRERKRDIPRRKKGKSPAPGTSTCLFFAFGGLGKKKEGRRIRPPLPQPSVSQTAVNRKEKGGKGKGGKS